jgi:dihydroorotate dehydrogenase (fumarate)
MDLSTKYLGIDLPHPIVPSAAQPLTRDVDRVKALADAGAAAVVLHSLFEEQIKVEAANLDHFLSQGTESFAEALTYYPAEESYVLGPDEYLDLVRGAKETAGVPIVGSLNGMSTGGWTEYAGLIEQAGADALELNVYYLPTDPNLTAADVESVYLNVLSEVKSRVSIPVAVKLGPYFSSLANFAKRLADAGADGLSLFNRFYQPDIDPEELTVDTHLNLSGASERLLPLRWIAILRGQLDLTLAATTGIYNATDALKLTMAGADVVHVCAAVLRSGYGRIAEIRDGMAQWLEEHEYESLSQARGSMSQENCPEPAAFERANYMQVIHDFTRDYAGPVN